MYAMGGHLLNKGFTLIELLAVIVILAIIALIATPIVLNIINDARQSSLKRSIENYGKAVEQAVASYQLSGNKTPRGLYTTTDGKKLILDTTELNVNYNGSKIICNTINVYNDGQVYLGNCAIDDKSTDIEYGPKYYANGTPVYFNITSGLKCTESEYTSNANKYLKGCLKFYAFNDLDSDKINLISNQEICDFIPWNSSNNTLNGPVDILDCIKTYTSNWKGTEIPTNYYYENGNIKYSIDYSSYKARLITVEEIAKMMNITTWTVGESMTIGTVYDNYEWLYNSLSYDIYYSWTATADSLNSAYVISSSGIQKNGYVDDTSYVMGSIGFGARTVIEVLKSKLN